MSRPARALLDSRALRHNLEQVRRRAPRSRIMAVVKANAYGHGLGWAARVLREADAFGVASLEEGMALRRVGIENPVCLLEGIFGSEEIPQLGANAFSVVVHDASQLQMLESSGSSQKIDVWVKFDTGMHRLGFAPDEVGMVCDRLKRCSGVGNIRLMSHFCCADDVSSPTTQRQIELFRRVADPQTMERSLANSAGIGAWPDSHFDWVRPGIMLYGGNPLASSTSAPELKPVMTFSSALISIHRRQKGEPIGYGADYRCPEDMPVGVVAIGYGDGYPRHVSPGTEVLVNGQRAPLAGRVSMDMITVDLRNVSDAHIGDPVVLWGAGLSVDEVASKSGTISYDLLCRVADRVPRVPVGADGP